MSSPPSSFSQLTVPQLRQVIRDGGYHKKERGLLSRLKRKQDLIDFLQKQSDGGDDDDDDEFTATPGSRQGEVDSDGDDDDDDDNECQTIPQLSNNIDIDPTIWKLLPTHLQQGLIRRGITQLLPIQHASFVRIYQGHDTVLQAPTGQGKTLAFCLPLLAQERVTVAPRAGIATPQILVLCPSRELARQVGKEWQRCLMIMASLNNNSKAAQHAVATVFGGVPVERHVALLRYKPTCVVATPGRLRELVRLGHLSYDAITTVVLDEADVLLNTADNQDVQAILSDVEQAIDMAHSDSDGDDEDDGAEYQLILVSVTLNDHVRRFTADLEIPSRAYISASSVNDNDGNQHQSALTSSSSSSLSSVSKVHTKQDALPSSTASSMSGGSPLPVQHWHMACKSAVRPQITANYVTMLDPTPRLTLIFVPTKNEAESVATVLGQALPPAFKVSTIHGDLSQTVRSRTIAAIRASSQDISAPPQVLVATDVISRGLDFANVDLVINFGIPRVAGKEGTYDTDLYTHRTGRAGRFGLSGSETRPANALVLYDPAVGEARLLAQLAEEVEASLGRKILAKPVPSTLDIVNTGYQRAVMSVLEQKHSQANDLIAYFRSKLEKDIDTSDKDALLDALARAMIHVANLDPALNPTQPHASLLSGDPTLRTVRVQTKDGSHLSPPQVTAFCKSLGSGKLGRVSICVDGSAVFDMPLGRAEKLVQATTDQDWTVDLPLALPEMS